MINNLIFVSTKMRH